MDISCQFPWIVNFVRLYDDSWKFCCKVSYNNYEDNKKITQDVKDAFLNGRRHPVCQSCWSDESKDGVSFRTSEPQAKTTIDILKQNPSPRIIDLEFGDICNMHCLSCGPYNSSTWQAYLKTEPRQNNKFQETWQKLANIIATNPSITLINMHGGEPSMDPNFEFAVENIIALGFKKKLRIITNGNYSDVFKQKFENNIQKLLDNGNRIEILFSLDAAGIDGEWLRGGLNMSKFCSNIIKMSELDLDISVNISISILNLENHIDILHLLEKINLLERVYLKINTVNKPHHLSISNLGSSTKEFLPTWPSELSTNWMRYKDYFDKLIAGQLATEIPPNKKMLGKLLSTVERYNEITGKTLTPYYENFIDRIKNICYN